MRQNDSICRKNKYCSFEQVHDDPHRVVEVCTYCSKKVEYKKDGRGRVDNIKYLADHIRDFVQPHGKNTKVFYEIYGKEGSENVARTKRWAEKRVSKEKRADIRGDLAERRGNRPPLVRKTEFQLPNVRTSDST